MGDVHGDFIPLFNHNFKDVDLNGSLIIQVGDFGLGFRNKRYDIDELKFINNLLLERAN